MTDKIVIPEAVEMIAFISDIHGRYEEVLATKELMPDIDYWFCAGDIVDMYLQPHYNIPTVRLMHRMNIPSVKGNHDYYITRNSLEIFEPESQEYLSKLPLYLDILFGSLEIRIYHATPQGLDHYIPPSASKETYNNIFGHVKANVFVLGHTHSHYIKGIEETMFVNPGSLGMPDKEPTFCVMDSLGNVEFKFLT